MNKTVSMGMVHSTIEKSFLSIEFGETYVSMGH